MPRLLDQVRASCRRRGYSYQTEKAHCRWVVRYVRFHDLTHPEKLGADAIEAFLTHLATERMVAASTQNQALNALVFLYREVLKQDVDAFDDFARAKAPRRLPVVLSRREVRALLGKMRGQRRLIASLLYGSGLRLSEALRLRIKDLDFERRQLLVRSDKGKKDRLTMLPEPLEAPLRRQLKRARLVHEEDLAEGFGAVHFPKALARKYPQAEKEWIWQWVFPSRKLSKDPRSEDAAAPPLGLYGTEGRKKSRAKNRDRKAREPPHAAPLLCHAPPGGRSRHPHGAGAPRPQEPEYNDDLHACGRPGCRSKESTEIPLKEDCRLQHSAVSIQPSDL